MRSLLAAFGIAEMSATNRAGRRDTASLLLAAIEANSGAPIGHIVEKCQLAAGTAYYHLAKLEEEGRIRTIVAGRRRLVFMASDAAHLKMDPHSLALIRGKTASAVALALVEHAPISILGLVARVGGSPRAVYYHVKRLKGAQLVDSTSPRRYRHLTPTPKLRLLLALTTERVAEDDPGEGAAQTRPPPERAPPRW